MALLPSCLREGGKVSIQLKNLDISAAQESQLAEIAELIIPKTDTSGAKDLNLHLYVLKMLDDCFGPERHQQFMGGLKNFEGLDSKALAQLVTDANTAKAGLSEETIEFFKFMKWKTIDGYLNSKYVMSNLVIWELVPGRYNGFFRVKSA